MKILVATRDTQGARRNDFCHAQDGEVLFHGFECDKERVDGPCGCKRSFSGMTTLKAATTFKVVEAEITRAQFTERLTDALVKGGWFNRPLDTGDATVLSSITGMMLGIADAFPAGTVLERRGKKIVARK